MTVRKGSSKDGYLGQGWPYFFSARARRFQSGFVTRENQKKNPRKHERKVVKAYWTEKTLLATAKKENITKDMPPKQAVISEISLNVMSSFVSGRKKENGHQMKSLSLIQL